MKGRIILICLLLVVTNLNAQVKGILNYEVRTVYASQPQITNLKLYFIGSQSMEISHGIQNPSAQPVISGPENNQNMSTTMVIKDNKPLFIYKNFSKKILTLSDHIGGRKFLINDTLSNFHWKITTDHQKILKYNCTKAITRFRGRNYEAWFTDDIPVQNGPWKFCGLPGLIVKVTEEKGKYSYELTSVEMNADFDPAKLSIPAAYARDQPVSHTEFISLYEKKVKELEAYSRASYFSKDGISGSSKVTIPEKKEKY